MRQSYMYVASAYTHANRQIEWERYLSVMDFMTWLARHSDVVPYSPILHCHDWADRHELPKDADWWRQQNSCMLRNASGLYVLMFDGWNESKGVTQERQLARDLAIPITGWTSTLTGYFPQPLVL